MDGVWFLVIVDKVNMLYFIVVVIEDLCMGNVVLFSLFYVIF